MCSLCSRVRGGKTRDRTARCARRGGEWRCRSLPRGLDQPRARQGGIANGRRRLAGQNEKDGLGNVLGPVRVAHMASGKDVKTRYKSTETRPVQLNWPRLDVIRWKYQAVWLSRNDFFIRQAMRPAIPTPSIARGLGRGTLVVATPSMPTVKPYQFSKTGV